MSRGEGREAPRLTVIYWRDIPTQIKARAGRNRASAPLPDRFMVAVDRAATIAGKTTTDEYIGEWREETRSCGDDLESEVRIEAKRVDEAFPAELLTSYLNNGGWAP
ncbi:MAG: virulence factor [Acidimicrobiia bacterium]